MAKEDACLCGKKSTKGCHGIKDREVYSEFYCDECFNKRNLIGKKDKKYESTADSLQED